MRLTQLRGWKDVFGQEMLGFEHLPGAWAKARFFNCGTINILGQIILFCRGCPVLVRMFRRIPGLYSLDASSTPQLGQAKISLEIAKLP